MEREERARIVERAKPGQASNAPLSLGGVGVFVAGVTIATGSAGPFMWFVGLVSTALLVVGLVRR